MKKHDSIVSLAGIVGGLFLATAACADPTLPDWTAATFGPGSATATNPYFSLPVGRLSVYEGTVDDGVEVVRELVSGETVNILGIENRVVKYRAFLDGRLVETAEDWYAQDTDGNVWYFGEFVVNYRYDDSGTLIDTDNDGSWMADGVDALPGIIQHASPTLGEAYFEEYAPGIALDFGRVDSVTDALDTALGSFTDVWNVAEGNLIDGPEFVERKFYAMDVGLIAIQALDDEGEPEFQIDLIRQRFVPAPGSLALTFLAALTSPRRRRGT